MKKEISDNTEFTFTRKPCFLIGEIKEVYEKIFESYFLNVHNINEKIEITFEDLNTAGYEYRGSTNRFQKLEYPSILKYIMPYTQNFRVICNYSKGVLFDFFIYGQNNCCGAMTTSKTFVYLKNKGIGTIVQYLKEDIAIQQGVSLITCTSVYYEKCSYMSEVEMNNLTPYLANVKLLLKTGWNISKLFWNSNSKNVVGLFTKNVIKFQENKIIKMKIKEDDKLVEIKNITVGCDPELFFRSKETGDYVASFSVIKGDKNNPTVISEKGHNIQCDNVMVEYGVPPSKTAVEFVENNIFVQKYLKEKVADQKNLELVIFPFVLFPDNELKNDRAQVFGCDPDFDVWNGGRPNEVGRAGSNGRCAGGHIHIGYDNHNRVTNNYIVKALDLFLSIPLTIMEPENRRKEMYGKAGSYRPQPWGVEYRSTSNYIFSSPELMTWAFEQVQKAIDFVNNADTRSLLDVKANMIIEAINSKNKSYAQSLIQQFNIKVLEEVLTN